MYCLDHSRMQTDYLPAERYFLNWTCLLCCITLFFAVLAVLFSTFFESHILCKCALFDACVQCAHSCVFCWPSLSNEMLGNYPTTFLHSKLYTLFCLYTCLCVCCFPLFIHSFNQLASRQLNCAKILWSFRMELNWNGSLKKTPLYVWRIHFHCCGHNIF